MNRIISKLIDVKDDVDAIDHHQSDRIVSELKQVIEALKTLERSSTTTTKVEEKFSDRTKSEHLNMGLANHIIFSCFCRLLRKVPLLQAIGKHSQNASQNCCDKFNLPSDCKLKGLTGPFCTKSSNHFGRLFGESGDFVETALVDQIGFRHPATTASHYIGQV